MKEGRNRGEPFLESGYGVHTDCKVSNILLCKVWTSRTLLPPSMGAWELLSLDRLARLSPPHIKIFVLIFFGDKCLVFAYLSRKNKAVIV